MPRGSQSRSSLHGHELNITDGAGRVELIRAPPIPAQARAELLVIKNGLMFLCARPTGDVLRGAVSGEGLYREDTRYLSELRVGFGGAEPVLLSNTVDSGYRAVVDATNPAIGDVPQEMLHLRRTLLAAERLYCELELHNYCPHPITVALALALAADFADVFEVRGVRARTTRGRALAPEARGTGVVFGYEGQDGVLRTTVIEADRAPGAVEIADDRAVLEWKCTLDSHACERILVAVSPASGERNGSTVSVSRASFARASQELDRALEGLRAESTRIESDSKPFEDVITAAMRDLDALETPTPSGRIPAAGIPWFVAPFGRDSLWTCLEALLVNPRLARETLEVLAGLQAREDEPWRDAEPGKILHELRSGELARAGLIPHTPYYGTVDATPLFVVLAAGYYAWTGDLVTLASLRPAIDRALEWIDRYGDADGDGFVEYSRRSPAGLANQGWKDSEDAIVHADGTLAEGPIALVEVQGYVYLAKSSIADFYEQLGERDRARQLRAEAAALREAFNETFWDPDEGTFVLALDGAKRQVRSVASNAGHCLYCGIVDGAKATAVGERLMARDMFSGWGVRTLSAQSPAYNPMSYHNGSVWPHDNAIICAGLKAYGLSRDALRIASAMLDIATRSRDMRLAELYCGFDRTATSEIVSYPVACRPQAWAAVAPCMLLQATLGVSASAPDAALRVIAPTLPPALARVELHGLRVGDASVDLAFTRSRDATELTLLGQRGELSVNGAVGPR